MCATVAYSPIALIAAVAANGAIGLKGNLPWHLPLDLKYFKSKTLGKRIIMGRRTWQSFPKPLPHREHVVISSQNLHTPENVTLVSSLEQALALPFTHKSSNTEKIDTNNCSVFIIGGSQIYSAAMPYVSDLFLTEINATVKADTFFPTWDRSLFAELSRETHTAPLTNDGAVVSFSFVHYRRTFV